MTAAWQPRDGWMAMLEMGDAAYIYDPRNSQDDGLELADLTRAFDEAHGRRCELKILCGAERPEFMYDDDNGAILGWGDGSSLLTMQTRALAVDDMDFFGFDSTEHVALLWLRARLFVDALNAHDFAEVAA